jgi:hypothetical protein
MTLRTVSPPDRGSLSVVYSCPECGYEIAMLTNAYETQLVQSLGVRIGPQIADTSSRVGAGDATSGTSAAEAGTSAARCPFSAMIPSTQGVAAQASEPAPVRWTAAAEARLANVPEFVRPMARTGIERFARDRGAMEVDDTILDAAREFFGM